MTKAVRLRDFCMILTRCQDGAILAVMTQCQNIFASQEEAQLKMVIDRFYSFPCKLSGRHLKTAPIAVLWDLDTVIIEGKLPNGRQTAASLSAWARAVL